jgi:hypothetical protein
MGIIGRVMSQISIVNPENMSNFKFLLFVLRAEKYAYFFGGFLGYCRPFFLLKLLLKLLLFITR